MSEEILNKLHTALYSLTPLASERERIISEMGEVIWLESLERILIVLPEDTRARVIELLNEEDLDSAVAIVESSDIDIDAILSEVATSLMDDVLDVADK